MDALFDIVIGWPMPVVWLLLVALIAWRWRRLGRALFTVAVVLLVVSSLPVVGRLLAMPLRAGAVPPAALEDIQAAAIVVPTGGAYRDPAGGWWPNEQTIIRIIAGRELQARLGLPLIISGGAPLGEPVAEAEAGARRIDLPAEGVRLETTAQNSAETARAVAAMLADVADPTVVLVTSPTHILRMQGALRRQGLRVRSIWATDTFEPPDRQASPLWAAVPSRSGLNATAGALREYTALGWYLANGWVRLADLRPALDR